MPDEAPVIKITFDMIMRNLKKKYNKKKASYLHHTATTVYLCCVPTLED